MIPPVVFGSAQAFGFAPCERRAGRLSFSNAIFVNESGGPVVF
jgi:hypothetical protein